jgi:D-alanine-D-alanine ligase
MPLLHSLSHPIAGLCFNLKNPHTTCDTEEEYDSIETIDFLEEELRVFGFKVLRFNQDESLLTQLHDTRPHFVFNIAEGKGTSRSRESQVPALLDWLAIPYYGSDALTLGITLDKWLTNVHLSHAGVAVPKMFVINETPQIAKLRPLFNGSSFIVKPRWEGSSKGIFKDSVVSSLKECTERVERILSTYKQPAVIEEFLCGEEITVAVAGNKTPKVLGMMHISQKEPTKQFIYSIENKRSWRETICYEQAKKVLSPSTIAQIEKEALNAFQALEIRDISRIDFRLDEKNIPRIIDINPLPGLSPEYSDLMLISGLHGLDFRSVVHSIITLSLQRNKLLE